MSRSMIVLALVSVTASAGFAKDLCIQLNNGPIAGSQITLKKVKVGKRNFGPVYGYVARYSAGFGGFSQYNSLHGSSIVDAAGSNLALSLSLHDVGVLAGNGSVSGSAATTPLNLSCSTGSDSTFGVLDPCSGRVFNTSSTGHVIECSEVAAIE